jgi:NAD(P)-dependent dehydrogenase (short-subunit alcohol dehydrogenase family)
MPLDDRVVVVTGGAQGIGQGIALRLAAAGGRVAVFDRQPATETLARLAELSRPALGVEVDVSDAADVARAYERLDDELGRPYALVNAAGVFADIPFLDTPVEVWDHVMAINARGVFLSCQEGARRMRVAGEGRIVNILSTASVQGFALESAYCASKGAVLLLTRVLAVELAPLGITVNGVGPGTVETAMGRDYLARGPIAGHELSRTPMGRFGQPADIAETVCFLVTEATWLTGQAIYVDGGFLATGLPVLPEMS